LLVSSSRRIRLWNFFRVNRVERHCLRLAGVHCNIFPGAKYTFTRSSQRVVVVSQFRNREVPSRIGMRDVGCATPARLARDDRVRHRFVVRTDHNSGYDARSALRLSDGASDAANRNKECHTCDPYAFHFDLVSVRRVRARFERGQHTCDSNGSPPSSTAFSVRRPCDAVRLLGVQSCATTT